MIMPSHAKILPTTPAHRTDAPACSGRNSSAAAFPSTSCVARARLVDALEQPVAVTYHYLFASNYDAPTLALIKRNSGRGDLFASAGYPEAALAALTFATAGVSLQRCERDDKLVPGWTDRQLEDVVRTAVKQARWCYGEHVAWVTRRPVAGNISSANTLIVSP